MWKERNLDRARAGTYETLSSLWIALIGTIDDFIKDVGYERNLHRIINKNQDYRIMFMFTFVSTLLTTAPKKEFDKPH